MEALREFDKSWYVECASYIPFGFREYNNVLSLMVGLNGWVSLSDISTYHKATRSIQGASAVVGNLHNWGFITLDFEAHKVTHRNEPRIHQIHYDLIEHEAMRH